MGVIVELLTDDAAIADLCTCYWTLDAEGRFAHRVADLVLPPGIAAGRVAAFVAEHCRVYDADAVCEECSRRCVVFASRADYERRRRWPGPLVCDDCRRARADREQAARDAAVEEKRSRVAQHFRIGEQEYVVAPDELSFSEAVGLLALFRLTAPEGLGVLSPVGEADRLLAPTAELTISVLLELYGSRCISIAPQSPLSAFADDGQRFYPLNIAWLPPVDEEDSPAGVLAALESVFREAAWPQGWLEQCRPFWREVARHECLQYMQMCLGEHGFEFSAGDKTKQMLDSVLESYSVGQVYTFIWRAAKDAAAYYVRDGVPKRQAANSIVGRIQRMAERGLAEGWEVKPYRRDRRAPESMLSHVLYRVALRLSDDGISHVPSSISVESIRHDKARGPTGAGDEGQQ